VEPGVFFNWNGSIKTLNRRRFLWKKFTMLHSLPHS
jgi:hypothetical protein